MSTYTFTVNNLLVEEARSALPTNAAVSAWIQQQVERMLRQVALPKTNIEKMKNLSISERIKSLSAVPPCSTDEDYKDTSWMIVDSYSVPQAIIATGGKQTGQQIKDIERFNIIQDYVRK